MTSLAIDFDCTLHSYDSGFQTVPKDAPVDGAIQAIADLATEYETIYIFTARDVLAPVEAWMKEQFKQALIPYPDNIEYTNVKPKADIYIDDKGYQFTGDWAKTIDDIKKYKTWMNENRLPTFMQSYEMANLISKKRR